MDRTMSGPALMGAGLKGMIRLGSKLGSKPIETGVKAVTSFASLVGDFNKRRKKQIEDRVEQSKVIKGKAKVPDPEADKQRDDAENDPDLEKIFRDENPNVVDLKKPNKPKK